MKEGGHGELEGRRRARRSEAASGSAGQMFAGQLIYGELAERSSQDIRSHYSPDMALRYDDTLQGQLMRWLNHKQRAVSCDTLF